MSPRRTCPEHARPGTGTGVCDAPLDSHGNCPRASEHLDDLTPGGRQVLAAATRRPSFATSKGELEQAARNRLALHQRRQVGPCPCECNSGGFCGGCGHAGCGGRR